MAIVLSTYTNRTYLQLQNPIGAAEKIFTEADIHTYINLARNQIAGNAECCRYFASLSAATDARVLNFSDIDTGVAATTGINGVFNVRQVLVQIGNGRALMTPRPFPWFASYHLNKVIPETGLPTVWSQYGQGDTGSIYIDPLPDQAYTLNLDCVCIPIDLEDDTSFEAIPAQWTDVVPFYAAWYALTAAQRQTDADKMMERVRLYMGSARGNANPDVVPRAYAQPGDDPTMANRIGVQKAKGG